MNGTIRPSRSKTKTVPSASEPVRNRPLSSSYSMPSGMKPPRSAVMTLPVVAAGGGAGAGAAGAAAGAGGGDVADGDSGSGEHPRA
jgi:hypothetical protein